MGRINASNLLAAFLVQKIVPAAQVYREDLTAIGSTLVDMTTAATDAVAGDFAPFAAAAAMSDGDSFYFRTQGDVDTHAFYVQIATPGVGTWAIDIQEWNATTDLWESITGLTDGSNGFKAATGVYKIEYTGGPAGKLKLHHADVVKYAWRRVKLVSPSGVTVAPVLSRIWVEAVTDTYLDITAAFNAATWGVLPTEILPVVGTHCLKIHPGVPIGNDVNVVQARSLNYTLVHEYLASDDTWKPIPDYTDPSNGYTVLGTSRIRWSRPADWVSKTLTINTVVYTGWMQRYRIASVTTQGPVAPEHTTFSSRALGSANAKGLVLGAGTYTYATLSAGANNVTGNTLLSLINAESGVTSTITIPQGIDEASDEASGKLDLSVPVSFVTGESMLVMCLSGGPLIDVSLRLHA